MKNTEQKNIQLQSVDEVLSSLQMNLKTPKDQKNNFGKYNYRKAEDILVAIKKELKGEEYPKVSIITDIEPISIADRLFIKCTAKLSGLGNDITSNGYAELEESKKGMDLAQLTGAATSYAKKYALGNLFAIDDSSDDPDSKDNSKNNSKQKATATLPSKEKLSNLAVNLSDDREDVIIEYLNKEFPKFKSKIENCKSVEKLREIWSGKENKKLLNYFRSSGPEQYELLENAKNQIKNELTHQI